MKRLATLAVAIALAFAGNMAFAAGGGDGAGGDSGGGDNSMSRWTGESYKAFEEARRGSGTVTITQAPRFKSDEKVERPRIAHLPRKPIATDPFRSSDS